MKMEEKEIGTWNGRKFLNNYFACKNVIFLFFGKSLISNFNFNWTPLERKILATFSFFLSYSTLIYYLYFCKDFIAYIPIA